MDLKVEDTYLADVENENFEEKRTMMRRNNIIFSLICYVNLREKL